MSIHGRLRKLVEKSECLVRQPRLNLRLMGQLPSILRGSYFGAGYSEQGDSSPTRGPLSPPPRPEGTTAPANPLRADFDAHETGRGIRKWTHYFDAYHRHFGKFVGKEVHVLEVGVYSGGSLEMWRRYFGPQCRVYGVDIEEACKRYENEYTEIFIGDQADRDFWKAFRKRVPAIDVLVDDGGHQVEQQIVTLEEMLPHLRPGGVYLCEDIHREHKGFFAYMAGLASNLNAKRYDRSKPRRLVPVEFQAWIRSVHFYPYLAVVEKAESPLPELRCVARGSEWQPFVD